MNLGTWLETVCIASINGRKNLSKPKFVTIEQDVFTLGVSWPLESFPYGSGCPVCIPSKDLRKHAYILGATGSGKTNILVQLVDQDIESRRSLVLIDLRGDLVERVLARLAGKDVDPSRVCLIDLRDDSTVVPFNPLGGSGDAHSRAFHVLAVLRDQAESWGVQLEETLRNALVALAEYGGTLTDIEPLLLDPEFRARVLASSTDPHVQSFFCRFNTLTPERQLNWALPVLNKVTPLIAVPRLRSMLGSSDSLDLRRVLDTPGSILLVSLAVDRFHGASHLIGGLLVSAIEAAVMARATTPEVQRNPLTLYVDEFETMASEAFLGLLAEGRRFGLSLVLSHQNLTQLSPQLRASLQGNAHLHLYFQTGAADASEIAKEVDSGFSREQVRTLLLRLKPGEALLIRRSHETLVVRTPLTTDPKVSARDLAHLRLSARPWIARKPAKTLALPAKPTSGNVIAWEVRDGF